MGGVYEDEDLCCIGLAQCCSAWQAPWRELVGAFGSAGAILRASESSLRASGFSGRAIAALRAIDGWDEPRRIRDRCAEQGIKLAHINSVDYPPLLREIPDPPLLIYYRGRSPALFEPAVAVVGARRASAYGVAVARELAGQAALAGLCVVSGLALGIDAAAHRGALDGGQSIAVMAGGLDSVYPSSNRALFERMVSDYTVLGEQPPGAAPLGRNFPRRNRIITGLSLATVVVEADMRSGSRISARLALEQGREVLAVPGNVDSRLSRGTNDLIRQGCPPLLQARDLFDSIGLKVAEGSPTKLPSFEQKSPEIGADGRCILDLLDAGPSHVDQLIERVAFDDSRVMELLTALELAGLARRLPDGSFRRCA
ncbi:MAG: DNA-processing protein DprA [Candidatus Binatia bacterium]